MTHTTEEEFWDFFNALPQNVRILASKNHDILVTGPNHPSLCFKRIGVYWSVRIGIHYRAVGRDNDTEVIWFWIGHHSVYDRIIANQ